MRRPPGLPGKSAPGHPLPACRAACAVRAASAAAGVAPAHEHRRQHKLCAASARPGQDGGQGARCQAAPPRAARRACITVSATTRPTTWPMYCTVSMANMGSSRQRRPAWGRRECRAPAPHRARRAWPAPPLVSTPATAVRHGGQDGRGVQRAAHFGDVVDVGGATGHLGAGAFVGLDGPLGGWYRKRPPPVMCREPFMPPPVRCAVGVRVRRSVATGPGSPARSVAADCPAPCCGSGAGAHVGDGGELGAQLPWRVPWWPAFQAWPAGRLGLARAHRSGGHTACTDGCAAHRPLTMCRFRPGRRRKCRLQSAWRFCRPAELPSIALGTLIHASTSSGAITFWR
jgi:hypothetical protein